MGSTVNFRLWVIMGTCILYCSCQNGIVNGAELAAPPPLERRASSCGPVLLMNCIGSQKSHPSDKCCAALRNLTEDKCFCSRLREGVVDPSTYTPIAQACGIPTAVSAKCKRTKL
ncbi:hypothetical protein SUGI_1064740 [Cryptomeria japonica]|uniref:uncharacterized protein LOC131064811 n=1 Tax=Cryptomeria japonica TaxID=3369 RepID=UPI002414771E|nr:uncharacterized protein LOC131064811 [Cryptomeria japonica]GLJ50063.1 hypothetical protein SUGI_1064740 [Cryptomeria japonica]